MKHDESGFSLVVVLLVLVVLIVGGAGWYIIRANHDTAYKNSQSTTQNKSTPPSGSYVLTGLVSEGPTSPGPCRSDQNCSDAPVTNHSMTFYDAAGTTVATTKTDSTGTYKVQLKPGSYTIKLEPAVGVSDNSYAVNVGTGNTTFNISVDTGLR